MLVKMITHDDKFRDAILEAAGAEGAYRLPWPLPNLKPISEVSFWRFRSTWSLKAEVWNSSQSVTIDGKTFWANVLVYWADINELTNGGFAVVVGYEYQKESVHYFEWRACDHSFHSRTVGHCLHRYTCSKCGTSYDVDSSG
jgi:hypothetical protein